MKLLPLILKLIIHSLVVLAIQLRHVHEFRNLMKTKMKITRVLDKISKPRVVYIFVLIGHQDSYMKSEKIKHKNNSSAISYIASLFSIVVDNFHIAIRKCNENNFPVLFLKLDGVF